MCLAWIIHQPVNSGLRLNLKKQGIVKMNKGHTFGEARKARIPDSYGKSVTMHPGTLN
jgi:hypothetical protein